MGSLPPDNIIPVYSEFANLKAQKNHLNTLQLNSCTWRLPSGSAQNSLVCGIESPEIGFLGVLEWKGFPEAPGQKLHAAYKELKPRQVTGYQVSWRAGGSARLRLTA